MDQLQFRVSAELKNILGRDLITSDNIAVLELVKNSYDAHATKVEITFGNDSIVIADNGKGMSRNDIINKWLFIAYSAKSDGTEDENYRSKIRRDFAGAKGIGRMSCDRLARYLTINTISEETGILEILTVDWTKFENRQTEKIDTVPVEHESSNGIFTFPDGLPHGTSLSFTGLRTDWGKDEIFSLRKSLEKMIAPLAGTDDFQIEVIAPNYTEYDNQLRVQISEAKERYEDLNDRERAEVAKWENSILNGPIRNSISDVLKIKTTQIESKLRDGKIITRLSDRGVLMYEIEEDNKYSKLDEASVDLYYLNRAAKYNFSLLMGMSPVNYGNVFLFRNGFRIMPYGEYDDDSWGLNQRNQQGYNRNLSTRELFGRVDVHSDDVNMFKEVSSRDGGLIDSEETRQLHAYFDEVEGRLERYVSGVLWGEAFLRKEYFRSEQQALEAREEIKKNKDSESPDDVFNNIGSKIDFLQLVKSLVNDGNITVNYYNSTLADVLADATATEVLNVGFLDDMRKVAEKTNDASLFASIGNFESYLRELQQKKEEAERKAEEEQKRAEEEKALRLEEAERRKKVEAELEERKKQNLFLQSLGTLDNERIIKYHHDIRLQSLTIQNFLSRIARNIRNDNLDKDKLSKNIELIAKANARVISIAQFATKANFNTTGDNIQADLVRFVNDYITEVLPAFYGETHLTCETNNCVLERSFRPLELSLLIDNLLSNSLKQNATTFKVVFENKEGFLEIDIIDDGTGLASSVKTPSDIFQKGYTTTNGSGLGLYSSADFIKKELGGEMSCDDAFNYSSNKKGFKLIIKLPL